MLGAEAGGGGVMAGFIRKVIECKRTTSITNRSRYECTLECGHKATRQCRWNRQEYVPAPPTKLKCVECEMAAKETKGVV